MNSIRSSSKAGCKVARMVRGTVLIWAVFLLAPPARAQWLHQSIPLKAGWNAVFLHVDASHRTLNAFIANDATNPIQEIWRWNPPPIAQFTADPSIPTPASEWTAWNRTNAASQLQRLTGDTAYLVRVDPNVAMYEWDIKGRPVPPRHSWSISGLNLIGFPTVPANPPNFASFLAEAPDLQGAAPEIYRYIGGNLGATNPVLLASPILSRETVQRGHAFWMRAGTVFNRYFGPFEIVLSGANGLDFDEHQGAATFRLRNLTASDLTVRMILQSSAAPPANQPPIAAEPPLMIRTGINQAILTYGYTNVTLGMVHSWKLAPRGTPGAEIEVVLGVNRAAIPHPPGTLLAGILRFADSLGHLQIHVPVSARAASSAGLWVGDATVSQVAHALSSYQRDGQNALVTTTNGNYVLTSVDTSLGAVSRPYPLRLIVHNPTNGPGALLLQRVYFGLDPSTNPVASNGESALHRAYLRQARRITATHLPCTASNTVWTFNGKLGQQTNLTTTVAVAYDDQAANPFLHTYHPDHDNRNATFDGILPQGFESYGIERAISLVVQPPADDFASLATAGTSIRGEYRENVTLGGLTRPGGGNDKRQLQVLGNFSLNRISDLPVLTLAP